MQHKLCPILVFELRGFQVEDNPRFHSNANPALFV